MIEIILVAWGNAVNYLYKVLEETPTSYMHCWINHDDEKKSAYLFCPSWPLCTCTE